MANIFYQTFVSWHDLHQLPTIYIYRLNIFLNLNRKRSLNTLFFPWEETIHDYYQLCKAESCDFIIFNRIYKYFKIIAFFKFLAIVCFNSDALFCCWWQSVKVSVPHILSSFWPEKKNGRYWHTVAGDNTCICFRAIICAASTGMNCFRRQYV